MILPLNQQVSSLEYSKKLKELGVPQESVFWWHKDNYGNVDGVCYEGTLVNNPYLGKYCSAFTVGKLLDMIPPQIEYGIDKPWAILTKGLANTWDVGYGTKDGFEYKASGEISLPDKLAKMLVWLIENKHLNVLTLTERK